VAAQLDELTARRKKRVLERLARSTPVYVCLLPAKDAQVDVDTPQPIVLPASYVNQLDDFSRKSRLVQARFQRFSIHALHSARVIGERVRVQARKRERRPRSVRRRGGVSKRAGPLPKSDDPELARTARGAR
jgi:hypothetical protein